MAGYYERVNVTVFSTKRRISSKGVPGVAPFIDGMNVWDIPTAHWTEEVKHAVVHAYFLGRASAERDMLSALRENPEPITTLWGSDE